MKPEITTTIAFKPDKIDPKGISFFLVSSNARISKPPDDPEALRIIPAPNPPTTPPKIDDKIGSEAMGVTGMI